jgi:Zn finger protein HypA/HybF involved in hydrogenase expression
MHELSLAEELVEECSRLAGGHQVLAVEIRCTPGLDLAELEEGFHQLAAGNTVEGAELRLEEVPAMLRCECGFERRLSPVEVAGHLAVCPRCGQVQPASGGIEELTLRLRDERRGGSDHGHS